MPADSASSTDPAVAVPIGGRKSRYETPREMAVGIVNGDRCRDAALTIPYADVTGEGLAGLLVTVEEGEELLLPRRARLLVRRPLRPPIGDVRIRYLMTS